MKRIPRPSPAMVVALIGVAIGLTGTAYGALGKSSVGTRQLKPKAVTAGKLANNSVRGIKIANGSVTGDDISIARLPTVPTAKSATFALDAGTVGGHAATCPPGTILSRGICYDAASNPVVGSVQVAADGCNAKGGYLPTPLQLYSLRDTINLGSGAGTDQQYADAYYAYLGGGQYRTIVVDGKGAMTDVAYDDNFEYICAYPLVR